MTAAGDASHTYTHTKETGYGFFLVSLRRIPGV